MLIFAINFFNIFDIKMHKWLGKVFYENIFKNIFK